VAPKAPQGGAAAQARGTEGGVHYQEADDGEHSFEEYSEEAGGGEGGSTEVEQVKS
jgi:hypothetical protein